MATKEISGLDAALDNDLSLADTDLPVSDDNGDTVRATLQQIHDVDTDPVKNSLTADVLNLNGAPGAAESSVRFTKKVGSIPNNSATAVLTVTVPNEQHIAKIKLDMTAICGAGGAVGVGEAMAELEATVRIVRRAGLATAPNVTTRETSQTQNVSGGATLTTFSVALSSISGAASAEQTFTVNVTIARNSGSADNHMCLFEVTVINENASGITAA